MSVRIELSAFDLAKLQALLGSESQKVIDELAATLDQASLKERSWAYDLGEKGRAEYRRALSTAITAGVPLEGLKAEHAPHLLLASHLARCGQRHRRIDCGIPREIVQDLIEEQGRLFGTEGKRLLRFLVAGRPLFGQRIGTKRPTAFSPTTRSRR